MSLETRDSTDESYNRTTTTEENIPDNCSNQEIVRFDDNNNNNEDRGKPSSPTHSPCESERRTSTSPPPSSPTPVSFSRRNSQTYLECAGCGRSILDRYYLFAVDQRWHVSCLKCAACDISLDTEVSCFTKEGKIFCKQDYFK